MTFIERLRRHREEHGCEEALEEALRIIDVQAAIIASLTTTPTTSVVTIKENPMIVGATSQGTVNYFDAAGNAVTAPTGTTVVWSSVNESVATVDTNGLVTGVAVGTSNIGAISTFPDGSTQTATPATADVTAATGANPASSTVTLA